MATKRRVYKLAERVHEVVARQLLKLSDPRLELVTITSVVVSPDMRNVKVYWVATGDYERIYDIGDAFEASAGIFKRVLAKDLGVRVVPEVRFFHDDTLDAQ